MTKNILNTYKVNINHVIASVKIYPLEYFNSEKMTIKDWYVVYRGNENKRVYARSFIKDGQKIFINKIKDHNYKVTAIEFLRDLIIYEFKTNPIAIVKLLYGIEKSKELYPELFNSPDKSVLKSIKLSQALEESLALNKSKSHSLYRNLNTMKKRFIKSVGEINVENLTSIQCKEFLYNITDGLQNTSFNTYKKQLSILLEGLIEREYLKSNYMNGVKPKKENPKKNKAFTYNEEERILELLKDYPTLEFLFWHVRYALLRQSAIFRLKVKHVNIKTRRFDLITKTGRGNGFIRYIPDILYNRYLELNIEDQDPEAYVIGLKGFFEHWNISTNNKDTHYGQKFKSIKEKAIDGDASDYGIKSARATGIGAIFKNKLQELIDNEDPEPKLNTLKFIKAITKHSTVDQVETYLRGYNFIEDVKFDKYIN